MNTLAITSNILKYENDEFVSVKKYIDNIII